VEHEAWLLTGFEHAQPIEDAKVGKGNKKNAAVKCRSPKCPNASCPKM